MVSNYNVKVSVIIVSYNSKKYIKALMESLFSQKTSFPFEIIIVDNCSTDNSYEYIKSNYPQIKLIKNTSNSGYGAGNNLGVKYARGEYIIIMNPDVIISNNLICELTHHLENNDQGKIISIPKILTYDGSMISSAGLIIHFTGLTFTKGWKMSPKAFSKKEYVNALNGCCFAIRKKEFIELGGFDEVFFMYKEDTELSWRANAHGFKIIYCPEAVVMHDYSLKLNAKKIYHLEFGRYILLRKYYSIKEILILLPSLLTTEILISGYFILSNPIYFYYKFRAFIDAINTPVKKIRLSMNSKKNLYDSLDYEISKEHLSYSKIDKFVKSCANKLYAINYKIFKKLVVK